MTDERSDLPKVLSSVDGGDDVASGGVGPGDGGESSAVRAGDGEVLVPREDQPDTETEPGMDGDQDPQEAMRAWLRAAEGMILAYWHDPRTAIKYAVAVLRVMQATPEAELLAMDPTTIPPITETQVGWQ